MRTFVAFFSFLGCLAISGCASLYSEDFGDVATARVRFVVTYPDHTWVSLLNQECYKSVEHATTMAFLARAYVGKPTRKSIGMPIDTIDPNARFAEVRVRAGVPLNIAFFGDDLLTGVIGMAFGGQECVVATQFVADPDVDYELRFKVEDRQCVANLHRLSVSKGDVLVREPVDQVRALSKCR